MNIDCAIFSNRRLSFAQSLILFLKEEKKLSFSEIARLLNRDPRTIWSMYDSACKKLGTKFYSYESSRISIPIEEFQNRKLSLMEAGVLYLKKQGLKNKDIADLIKRDQKTISSLLVRIKKRGDIK